MGRTFLLASALKPQTAARAAAWAASPPDVVVRSPSPLAREAAAIAVGGRWVFTIDEPLLAPCAPGESGGDVLGGWLACCAAYRLSMVARRSSSATGSTSSGR